MIAFFHTFMLHFFPNSHCFFSRICVVFFATSKIKIENYFQLAIMQEVLENKYICDRIFSDCDFVAKLAIVDICMKKGFACAIDIDIIDSFDEISKRLQIHGVLSCQHFYSKAFKKCNLCGHITCIKCCGLFEGYTICNKCSDVCGCCEKLVPSKHKMNVGSRNSGTCGQCQNTICYKCLPTSCSVCELCNRCSKITQGNKLGDSPNDFCQDHKKPVCSDSECSTECDVCNCTLCYLCKFVSCGCGKKICQICIHQHKNLMCAIQKFNKCFLGTCAHTNTKFPLKCGICKKLICLESSQFKCVRCKESCCISCVAVGSDRKIYCKEKNCFR